MEKIKIKAFKARAAMIAKARGMIGRFSGVRVIRPTRKLPNYYLIKVRGDKLGTVVDVGCGFDADFSMYMIRRFGTKAIGIDPTLKHRRALAELVKKSNGRFDHLEAAISHTDGKVSFNESVSSVSGSIIDEHRNVKGKDINRYEVESISLSNLPKRLSLPVIEYIKLDLEGAEYDLIRGSSEIDFERYGQLFIEFHHHAVAKYTTKDTMECVKRIESFGFESFTLDKHDYLFYRPQK